MKLRSKKDPFREWHKKFAWFPVKVGPDDFRWLEYVERRGERVGGFGERVRIWEYRAALSPPVKKT